MMKIGIMQPYFFPYLGYWQLINAVDIFVSFDDVNYINRGWINRNNILLNKQAHMFTLPLSGASQNKLINQISIIPEEKERMKLLKMFEQAYKKAPYFNDVFPLIQNILLYPESNLGDFLFNQFKVILGYLGIEKKLIKSSEVEKDNELKAQEKIIDICKHLKADHYINTIAGQELYDKDRFQKENMTLSFLKMNETIYKQFTNDFVPYLSIIDVLMFNSPADVRKMLDNYELV